MPSILVRNLWVWLMIFLRCSAFFFDNKKHNKLIALCRAGIVFAIVLNLI